MNRDSYSFTGQYCELFGSRSSLFLDAQMSAPPFGNLNGLRWCGETNRYYSSPNPCDFSSGNHYVSGEYSSGNPVEMVRHTPVSSRLLESLPSVNRKRGRAQSEDCCICLRSGIDQRVDPRMRFVSLPCKHTFHFYCAAQWLTQRSGSCPTCRTPVDTSLATAAMSAQTSSK